MNQRNETIAIQTENIRILHEKIEATKKNHHAELERLRYEVQDLKNAASLKEDTMANLHSRFEDIIQCQVVEIPIYANAKKRPKKKQAVINRSKSQNKMKSQLHFVREMAEEEDAAEFIEEDTISIGEQSMRSTGFLRQSTADLKKNKKDISMNFLNSVLDVDMMFTNQVVAAKIAEEALRDLEGEAEAKVGEMDSIMDEAKSLHEKLALLQKERDEYVVQVEQVQTEKDQIKLKFAKLLD